MRRWVAEGRIADDAWVWREGWTDWQPARDVLRVPGAPAPAPDAPQPAPIPEIVVDDNLSALRTDGRVARPSKSAAKTVVLVAALGLVSLALLVGLIQVILR
jgi:hypothetical protein